MDGWSSPRSPYVSCRHRAPPNKFLFFHVVVQFAITAVPSRSEFYRRLSQGASYEGLERELSKWLKGLDGIVVHMKRFLDEGGYGRV